MEHIENFDMKDMVIMEEKDEDECSVYQTIINEGQSFDSKNPPSKTQCLLSKKILVGKYKNIKLR
jgi:hypothetical protein